MTVLPASQDSPLCPVDRSEKPVVSEVIKKEQLFGLPHCSNPSAFSTVLKHDFPLFIEKCVLTFISLTVLAAMMFSFTQMAGKKP